MNQAKRKLDHYEIQWNKPGTGKKRPVWVGYYADGSHQQLQNEPNYYLKRNHKVIDRTGRSL